MRLSIVFYLVAICICNSFSQTAKYFPKPPPDTAQKKKIQIIQADSMVYTTQELGKFRKLLNHVILKHEDALMYCDSAIIDVDANYLTAYGKQVHINKSDTVQVWGDFLEYFGDQHLGRLTGSCSMRDNAMILTAPEINYNTQTDIGNYMSGGRIVNKNTTITSAIGYYYHNTGIAVFYGDVHLHDEDKNIYADSLRYDLNKEIAYFITKTKIIDKDSNVIITDEGYYDTKKKKAFFTKSVELHKEDTYVKANTLDYDDEEKRSVAQGNVIFSDSSQNITLLSNYMYSEEKNSLLYAYKDPLLIKPADNGKDTLYLSADTILTYKIAIQDTASEIDSIRILQSFYHTKIKQGEMSARCDSMYYDELDSIYKLYVKPVLWMDSTQISGDSIFLITKNKVISEVQVFNNAFIINLQDAAIFNQVKGKFITAYIEDDKIKKVDVDGNAESIYFIRDDDEAYIGANKSKSGFITMNFKDDKADRIKLTISPEAVFTPMKKIQPESFRLEGFNWQWNLAPKTIEDVIRDKSQYQKYLLNQQRMVTF